MTGSKVAAAEQCPAMSPESHQRCVLPDTAEAHYKGHESAYVDNCRAVWADNAKDQKRWRAAHG